MLCNTNSNYVTLKSVIWSVYISINYWVHIWCIATLYEVISFAFAIWIDKKPCNYLYYHQTTKTYINVVNSLYLKKDETDYPFIQLSMGKMSKEQKELLKVLAIVTIFKEATKQDFKKTKRRHYLPQKVRLQALRGRKCQLKHTTTCIALKGIIRTTSPASIRLMTRTFLFLKYSHITFMNTKKSESHL